MSEHYIHTETNHVMFEVGLDFTSFGFDKIINDMFEINLSQDVIFRVQYCDSGVVGSSLFADCF